MTKVKIWVPFDETECCMRVLSQDSEDYTTSFRAKNGFQIRSSAYPSLSVGRIVWLRGNAGYKDEFIARLPFPDRHSTITYAHEAIEAVKEFNKRKGI